MTLTDDRSAQSEPEIIFFSIRKRPANYNESEVLGPSLPSDISKSIDVLPPTPHNFEF